MKERFFISPKTLICGISLLISFLVFASCAASQQSVDNQTAVAENSDELSDKATARNKPNLLKETKAKPQRIVDETGDFVYEGGLIPVGDDNYGYMRVPVGYIYSETSAREQGVLRFTDATGYGRITLKRIKGMDYITAANKLYLGIQDQNGLENLTGATMHPSGYNAKQIYGVNVKDGYFFVAWIIEDPAYPSDCYYLSLEFDEAHKPLMALSSTFCTVEEYNECLNGLTTCFSKCLQ